MEQKNKEQVKPQIGYTLEQIEQIAFALNSVEVKGRSNLNSILLALQILEQGIGLEVNNGAK